MKTTAHKLFKETLIKAYNYIARADGEIDEKETALGKKMIRKENILEDEFNDRMIAFSSQEHDALVVSLKSDLKKLEKDEQIKILAYMSNIANADGFMTADEWRIIYKLYKEELQLQLEEILAVQKEIPPFAL